MKRNCLIIVALCLCNFGLGQRYIYSTTNSNYGNYELTHKNKFIIGDPLGSSDMLQMYKNSTNEDANFVLGNLSGRIQFAVAGCNGCFTSYATPGDGVIRKLGSSHDLFLVMANNNNDGRHKIGLGDSFGPTLQVYNNNKVVIGRGVNYDNEGYVLYVARGIKTEKIKVEIAQENNWADYVFDEDYDLISLEELESFIKKYKHLPEIPTEEEVLVEGVELKEMNIKLLKKVEELTLYILEQEDKINELQERVESLETK